MATPDLDVIKDIPGYKVILKAVIKSQIQQLVQQLATHTDEESVILTANVADGTLSHLGSGSGKGFLEDHEDIKSQFLGFCFKTKTRLEKEHEEKMLQMSSKSISVSPGHYMNTFTPRGRGGSHAYPFVSLHKSQSTRHQPYPASSPRRANQNFSPNSGKVQNEITESTSSGSFVDMDSENESLDQAASESVAQSISMNTSGSEVRAGMSERENDTQSSTSTIVNEPSTEGVGSNSNSEPTTSADLNETDQDLEITGVEPGRSSLPQNSWDPNVFGGRNFDPSDAMGSLGDTTASTIVNEPSSEGVGFDSNSELTTSADLNETGQDANVRDILEPLSQSELDLEITGVEPGRTSLPQNGLDPNVSVGMNIDPSDAMGSFGDTTAETNKISRFKCAVCGKDLKSAQRLKTHRRTHTRQRIYLLSEISRFKCAVCGKNLQSAKALEIHRRIHTGERPFPCPICKKRFTQKGNMQTHMNTVHQRTNE